MVICSVNIAPYCHRETCNFWMDLSYSGDHWPSTAVVKLACSCIRRAYNDLIAHKDRSMNSWPIELQISYTLS